MNRKEREKYLLHTTKDELYWVSARHKGGVSFVWVIRSVGMTEKRVGGVWLDHGGVSFTVDERNFQITLTQHESDFMDEAKRSVFKAHLLSLYAALDTVFAEADAMVATLMQERHGIRVTHYTETIEERM